MTPTRKRRLIAVLVIIAGVGLAAIVAFNALQENMLFFVSPSDVEEQSLPTGKRFRLGGLVAANSVTRADDSLAVMFAVTDGHEHPLMSGTTAYCRTCFVKARALLPSVN